MKFPSIGELRHRITIEQAAATPDGGGGTTIAWTPISDVWAAIRAVDGGEAVAAEALQSRSAIEIWIRYRTDITPAHRFVEGPRVLDIKSVLDPDGRRRWLRCMVEQRLG